MSHTQATEDDEADRQASAAGAGDEDEKTVQQLADPFTNDQEEKTAEFFQEHVLLWHGWYGGQKQEEMGTSTVGIRTDYVYKW